MVNRTIEEIVEEVSYLNQLVRIFKAKKWYQKSIRDRLNYRRNEARVDAILAEITEYEMNTNYEQL